MSYTKQINSMTWSFSRLHAYEQCPYAFYLRYIEKRDGLSNFYAANGKCVHEVFEAVLTHKIPIEDCPQYYVDKFDLICETERQSTMDSTFEKCVDYLCDIEDIDEDRYEILGVELCLNFKIDNYKILGFVDLLVRNKETGEVILVDHKSSPHFMKKDGTPLKTQLDNFISYRKQMYMYCIGIKEQLGVDVDKIVWHHFRDGGAITEIPYVQSECDETKQWVVDTIGAIKKDKSFEPQQSYVMCKSLCDFRDSCEYKEDEGGVIL